MNLNKVMLIGRLTQDVGTKLTPSGQPVASFGLATNRTWTDKAGQKQEQVEFHNIVFWGKQAETLAQYAKKGSLLYVEGRIQTREWKDKQEVVRKVTEIMGEQFQFGPKTQ